MFGCARVLLPPSCCEACSTIFSIFQFICIFALQQLLLHPPKYSLLNPLFPYCACAIPLVLCLFYTPYKPSFCRCLGLFLVGFCFQCSCGFYPVIVVQNIVFLFNFRVLNVVLSLIVKYETFSVLVERKARTKYGLDQKKHSSLSHDPLIVNPLILLPPFLFSYLFLSIQGSAKQWQT